MDAAVAAGFKERRFSLLPLAALAAVCLLGSASSVQAGCGDYLVGVSQTAEHVSHVPMSPQESTPVCRTCGERGTPIAPVVEIERLVVDPLLLTTGESPTLERGCWLLVTSICERQFLSQTPDRPPR
jgi:hypothetical protein